MGKKKARAEAVKERLYWFLAAAYVADVVGLLSADKAAKLASFEAAAGPQTWQEHVQVSLDVNDNFVKKVYALCRERKDEAESAAFILRGLGCPEPEDRLEEVLGEEAP